MRRIARIAILALAWLALSACGAPQAQEQKTTAPAAAQAPAEEPAAALAQEAAPAQAAPAAPPAEEGEAAPPAGESPAAAPAELGAEPPEAQAAETPPAEPQAAEAPPAEAPEAQVPPAAEGGAPEAGAPPAEPPPAAAEGEAEAVPPGPKGLAEAVEALTDGLVQTLPARENWVVAVADFADLKGKVTDLGRYLAQRATTRFSQQQGFRAVDRVRLLQALEELRVEASALTNPVLARRVGNHIGFNALVMGTLADLGEAVELDARLTDLDSGQQLPAVLVRLPKSPELMALVDAETIAPKPGAAQAAPAGMPGEAGLMVLDDAQPPPQTANDAYRVTVVLARKVGSALQLVIDFENLTPDVLPLLLRKNGYLIDERGERWNQTGPDSARIWVFCCDAGIELIPGTRLRTRLEFRGEGDGEGTAFTLVGKEISPQKERTLVLSGLRLKPAGQ